MPGETRFSAGFGSSPEDELLGGLPRTRPGRRSALREMAADPATSSREAPPPPRRTAPGERRAPGQPATSRSAVGSAAQLAGRLADSGGRLAGAGLQAAQLATRGLLRRLPRP
jgi:hypothetical protein